MTNNDVITKNDEKMWTSVEPNKISIVQKVLIRTIQNAIFIEFEPLCEKLWAFMSNLARPPTIIFLPNFILNIRKSHQIWGKLAQEQKSYRQKTKKTLPPPSVYTLAALQGMNIAQMIRKIPLNVFLHITANFKKCDHYVITDLFNQGSSSPIANNNGLYTSSKCMRMYFF